MKFNVKLIFVYILLFNLISCDFIGYSFFKVTKLSPKLLHQIDIPNPTQYEFQYEEIPAQLAVDDHWLVLSEPTHKSISIYYKNQLAKKITSKNLPPHKVGKDAVSASTQSSQNEHLNIPGMSILSNGNFYIINYTSNQKGSNQKKDNIDIPSYNILYFTLNGELKDIIYRDKRKYTYFENILWFDTDSNKYLWVLHKFTNTLYLSKYDSTGNLLLEFTEGDCISNLFQELLKQKTCSAKNCNNHNLKCEWIFPTYDSNKLLYIGQSYLNNKDSQNDTINFDRRVQMFDIKTQKSKTLFNNLNLDSEIPYLPYKNNTFLTWENSEFKKIKFGVYDDTGSLINHYQLSLDGFSQTWRKTYITLQGNFYTSKIELDTLSIYQWK